MDAQCDDKRGESDWKIKDSTLTFANDFLFFTLHPLFLLSVVKLFLYS